MILSLLLALFYIALVCIIVFGLIAVLRALQVPIPAAVDVVARFIVAVLIVLILMQAVLGNLHAPAF